MNAGNVEQIVRVIVETIKQNLTDLGVPVGVSARHIHLSREDADALFGVDYNLTKKADLMGGQYAAAETVTIVGAKMRSIENVRVIGPLRSQTQVEFSVTDKFKLGVSAPLRDSGDLKGSAPISVVGPKGAVHLSEGCIVAARHIHMSPSDAMRFSLHDGDLVAVEVPGERGLVFNDVKVRVHESFTMEMHIDTDEANACGVKTGDRLRILL